jgi:hypothetical protein
MAIMKMVKRTKEGPLKKVLNFKLEAKSMKENLEMMTMFSKYNSIQRNQIEVITLDEPLSVNH